MSDAKLTRSELLGSLLDEKPVTLRYPTGTDHGVITQVDTVLNLHRSIRCFVHINGVCLPVEIIDG